jgi:hypothetical protein
MIPFTCDIALRVTGSKTKARPERADGSDPGVFRSIYVVPADGTLGKRDALELHLPDSVEMPVEGEVIQPHVEAYVDAVALTNRTTNEPFVARQTKYRLVSITPLKARAAA